MKKTCSFIALLICTIAFVILVNNNIVFALDIFPKGPHHKVMEQLTNQQQKEIRDRMNELWESGASREEIHAEVISMLNNYGIEVPEDFQAFRGERGPGHGRGFMRFSDQLSKEQINSIKEKVKLLRENGASREDIHAEVTDMLNTYGIEVPEDFQAFRGERGPRHSRGFMRFSDQLSIEQINTIKEKVKLLRENGASREEIHTEVTSMLKEYGVDLPENFGLHREMTENLSREQRRAVRVKMREMRENGATPEEIRKEINKMLQEFGIDESDDQTSQTSQTSGKTLSIRSYPNPFNPETNIEYNLKSSSQVSITIYDVQGKQIRLLSNDHRQAGKYTIKWDGLNESGSQVPSGVYFIRISAGNETLNHRIVMMK